MRYISRRSESQPSTYWVDKGDGSGARVPELVVTPDEGGWFNVYSARSGQTYRVGVDGVCSCPAAVANCRHLLAVLQHARQVLGS